MPCVSFRSYVSSNICLCIYLQALSDSNKQACTYTSLSQILKSNGLISIIICTHCFCIQYELYFRLYVLMYVFKDELIFTDLYFAHILIHEALQAL